MVSIPLTKSFLGFVYRTISREHGAQPLSARRDCNNHPFIAASFHHLAIIYLRFRKFASSPWHIPLPQTVWNHTQQGAIIRLVRWQLFREGSAFFCRSQAVYKLTVLAKEKANVILGYTSWNTAWEAHGVMSPFCTALIRLLLQQPHLLPLVQGMAFQGKGRSAGKHPKDSNKRDQRSWKYSVFYCIIQHKEKEAGDGSSDTVKKLLWGKKIKTTTKPKCNKQKTLQSVIFPSSTVGRKKKKVVGFNWAKKEGC